MTCRLRIAHDHALRLCSVVIGILGSVAYVHLRDWGGYPCLRAISKIHSLIDLLVFTALTNINSLSADILGVVTLTILGLPVVAL